MFFDGHDVDDNLEDAGRLMEHLQLSVLIVQGMAMDYFKLFWVLYLTWKNKDNACRIE